MNTRQMNANRWQLSRAGLVNFWYYDEEIFQFANGKLLLRGTNGSGKSVTMQSFIPVVLDGKKSPDRLDPFGSKARRMEDYLLGEKDVTGRDERTGYLFLEFVKPAVNQYLTVGIGLKARRNSSMDFWGFAIQDNRRIGFDLQLYKTEFNAETRTYEKIPLSKAELEREIGSGGQVVHSQGEYAELVNKLVFGFKSQEAYEDLIKLLIQLRSPKLSKDFKPTVIYGILENALPGLSDEELRPLSDAIESMDRTQLQLEQLIRDQKALSRIVKEYTEYNRFIWYDKAKGLLESGREYRGLKKRVEEQRAALAEKQNELAELNTRQEQLKLEQSALETEKEQLQENDVAKAERERAGKKLELERRSRELVQKEQSVAGKKAKISQLRRTLDQLEADISKADKQIKDILDSLDQEAEENQFPAHELARREFDRAQADYSFVLWQKEARAYRDKLQSVLDQALRTAAMNERRQEAERSLAEAQQVVDQEERNLQQWEKTVEEEKNRYVSQVHEWQAGIRQLILPPEAVREVTRQIYEFAWDKRMDDIRLPVEQVYQSIRQTLLDRLGELRQAQKTLKEEKRLAEIAYEAWKNKREPEPARNEQTEQARRWLKEQGIPYVPFYAAVEFRPNVPEPVRGQIESALAEAGLLDALIIPEKYMDQVKTWGDSIRDRIIIANPKLFAHTVEEWFLASPPADGGVQKEDIEAVLQTILSEPENAESGASYVSSDGRYGIGVLMGAAPRCEKSVFVGREARERYRLEQMQQLESRIAFLTEQIEANLEKQQTLHRDLEALHAELRSFPDGQDLLTALQSVHHIQQQIKIWQGVVQERNQKVREAVQNYLTENERLKELGEGLSIQLEEATLRLALRSMNDYLDDLKELETAYLQKIGTLGKMRDTEERIADETEQLDDLTGEANSLRSDVEKLEQSIAAIDRMLATKGAEEVRNRLRFVLERLNRLPREIEESLTGIARIEKEIEQIRSTLEQLNVSLDDHKRLYNAWQKAFSEEYALGLWRYAVSQEVGTEKRGELDEKDMEALANWTVKTLQSSIAGRDREALNNRLQAVFDQERQANLVEYQPLLDYVFEIPTDSQQAQQSLLSQRPDSATESLSDHLHAAAESLKWEQLRQRARRRVILLEYKGERMQPYAVLEKMEQDILLQREVLTEEDQKLFKDVILQSVGKVIKHRIHRAQKWVEGMNELMRQRDTSSGLTFSLQWVPLTAEDESQIDTEELVKYLQKDPYLMREQDIERITNHFRSRIEKAKQEEKSNGGGETLHQIMRRVLDYRQWFRFKLRYKREGEPWKELTDRIFFTFSGGEKAMAMYIPLFSAAYSRYLEADPQAPMIISLDEAFAGVDENNIRDMFLLLEQLGFNYIMNSQALWGDYDTVSSLAICQLIRPKNADYVTVVRYRWDGQVLQLLEGASGEAETRASETSEFTTLEEEVAAGIDQAGGASE